MHTLRARHLIGLAALTGSLAGCHMTQLAATWRDPTVAPRALNKTVVAFATTAFAGKSVVSGSPVFGFGS